MHGTRTLGLALGLLVAAPVAAMELMAEQPVPARWVSEGWPMDFSRATVDFGEILDVIGPDNIPAIDTPVFSPAAAETDIPDIEPVIALEIAGDARAYPLRIMMWHEIVNDVVGGRPVAVTYCPLCNTSVVFVRELDGKAVTFGTTGKLRFSDLIMYDRGGVNWWQQFTGDAVVGERAGEQLEIVPSRLMSWGMFKAEFPDARVLQPSPGRPGGSGRNPYERYDTAPRPFLFNGALPEDIEAMARVVLVQGEGAPMAVALGYLADHQPLTIGDIEFRWAAGQASALDTGMISDGRDVGNVEVVRITGDAEIHIAHEITFAFAARAFHPGLEIVQ